MGKEGKAIQLIHHAYKDHITIQQLANAAGMSTAALYYFKAITSESPIQYLKSVRLHQARLFMV
ncbi:AraC family transcriptional regulator [Methylophaga sulfidovorans]|nr:AraC family transcriptional regulator [Methylophaga sulfidovorans]